MRIRGGCFFMEHSVLFGSLQLAANHNVPLVACWLNCSSTRPLMTGITHVAFGAFSGWNQCRPTFCLLHNDTFCNRYCTAWLSTQNAAYYKLDWKMVQPDVYCQKWLTFTVAKNWHNKTLHGGATWGIAPPPPPHNFLGVRGGGDRPHGVGAYMCRKIIQKHALILAVDGLNYHSSIIPYNRHASTDRMLGPLIKSINQNRRFG